MTVPRRQPTAPDWRLVIEQIVATDLAIPGIAQIIKLSDRALYALAAGAQPLYWRGEALVALWCTRTGLQREAIPLAVVLRGHRKARQPVDHSPRATSLPDWPPAAPVAVASVKRAGRKGKVKEPA